MDSVSPARGPATAEEKDSPQSVSAQSAPPARDITSMRWELAQLRLKLVRSSSHAKTPEWWENLNQLRAIERRLNALAAR